MAVTTATTRFWHPFADMGAVAPAASCVIERGEGVWVFDAEGNRYLDGTASLWYANLGHGREEIADAVAAQMRKLEAYRTFGDFANRPANELCERLAARRADGRRAACSSTSGGGDSIDARPRSPAATGSCSGQPERVHLIRRTQGYHGTHGFGTSLGGIEANVTNWGPLVPQISTRPVRLAAGARGGDPARRARQGRRVLLRAGDRRRRRARRRPRATSRASPTCAPSTASCSSSTA